ncbi:GDSL-type esterase/lipase family protein [Actinoplanes sp. NPDC051411]|uniref:SGNH/GDSL hydrolase family protein n=1 Tax=Actinoplanes sp. NPDC051411 TaxID=3155522 RepID=UPI003428229C
MRRPVIALVSLAAAALGSLGIPAAASADTPAPPAAGASEFSELPAAGAPGFSETPAAGAASDTDPASSSDPASSAGPASSADPASDTDPASSADPASDAGPTSSADPVSSAAPIRVMPLGDSITYGLGPAVENGYRTDLYGRLTRAGLNVDFVGGVRSGDGADPDNEGHPGWTIEQMSAQVDRWIAEARPDVVLLHAGTNDMRASATVPTAPAALSTLLDQIAADLPQAQVFVAQITGAGTTANRPMWKRRIDSYNARIPAIVESKGPHFHVVDQTGVEGIDLTDIVHPNTFGYAKMAWNWYQAMMPILDPGRGAWPETANPYALTVAQRCIGQSSGDIATYGLGCHTWYRRPETTGSTVRTWQLPVPVTKRVKVVRTLDGKPVATTVKVTTTRWIEGY